MCIFCGEPSRSPVCPACADEENLLALGMALLYGTESDVFPVCVAEFVQKLPTGEQRAAVLRELCHAYPAFSDGAWMSAMAIRLLGASARKEFLERGLAALEVCDGEGYCRLGCAVASAYDENYDYPEAMELARNLAEEHGYLPARLVLADCLMKLHRLEEAIGETEKGRLSCMDALENRAFPHEAAYRSAVELYRSFCRAQEDYQNRRRTGRQYVPLKPEGREKLARLLQTTPTALKRTNTRKHENQLCSDFVAFDLETTGVGREDRVTEIGAVKVLNGQITDRFDTFVDPGIPIPPCITRITGITDEMVAGAPTIDTALADFLRFAGELTLVAHNASFDLRFLMRDASRMGMELQNPSADTLALARKRWPGLASYKLTALTERFQIEQAEAHRAWCDAEATAELYLLIAK